MLITLTNDELTAAVKQYMGDEYEIDNIKFVISRSAGTSTKAEVTATRGKSTCIDVPEEEVTINIEKPSLFKGGNNE